MTPEPGSAAMERAFDELVFEYGGLCYDEGHEKRNHDTADGDAARLYHEILSAFVVLTRERDEAREALQRIAGQKLTSEIGRDELVINDIEGGYDACILEARAVVDKEPTT